MPISLEMMSKIIYLQSKSLYISYGVDNYSNLGSSGTQYESFPRSKFAVDGN